MRRGGLLGIISLFVMPLRDGYSVGNPTIPVEVVECISAINRGDVEQVIKAFDVRSMILLQELRILGSLAAKEPIDTDSLPPLPRALVSLQSKEQNSGWTGVDVGCMTGSLRWLKKETAKSLKLPLGRQYLFPANTVVHHLRELIGDGYEVRHVASTLAAPPLRKTNSSCFFSQSLGRVVYFMFEDDAGRVIRPIGDVVIAQVEVKTAEGSPQTDHIYFHRLDGEWKVIGSLNGAIKYIPSFIRDVDFPGAEDIMIASKKRGSFGLWLAVLPGNQVKMLSFGW